MATDKSDVSLVEAALQGDQSAFGELTRRYRGAAFGVAFSKLGDYEAARDAAQDALVRAYLDLPTLRDHSKFAHWLYSITLTTALGMLRRRHDLSCLDDPNTPDIASNVPNPHDAAERSERARFVREALAAIPEAERQPLILHYVDGYSHAEIGQILGVSLPCIKNRIYRARRRMREEMLVEIERSLKDERSPDVKDICVVIQWWGTPCHCRCRHCLLNSGPKLTAVPFARAKDVAEKFLRWRNEQGLEDLGVDIITGYSCDSPNALEAQLFSKQAGAASWWYLPANGNAMRSEEELRQFLQSRKDEGVTSVGVTFYGLKDFHDKWAGRDGDWEFTMLIARTAADLGLHRQETIFLSKDANKDIPDLVDLLDKIPGEKGRTICPWDYRGRGKKLEDQRVHASQVEALPEHIRCCISGKYRSEADWISAIEAGDYPRKKRRVYLLSVWEENIDWLESTDCGQILQKMRNEDELFYQSIPSLPTLAQLYGQRNGKRFYWLRDLEWKWTDLFLTAHPSIHPAGKFTDLDSSILWH